MPAQPTNGIAAPRSIKSLTIEAINLLEMSYLSSLHHAARSSALRNPPSHAMAGQHLEPTKFCASPEVTDTLALANLAAHIAVDRQMPTLLLTTKCSAVLFAFNLLLLRAGIDPRDLPDLWWTFSVFARLTAAAAEIARAPLLVMSSTPLAITWRTVLALGGDHRTRRIITDAGPEAIPHLQQISCAFGVPITMVSTIHRPPPPQ
jgi:hypothetical protein